MADTFISYSRADRERAQRVADKLKALGLDVWLDSRVPSGSTFDSTIEAALRDAKSVLVLWTPAAVESEWVRNEAMLGKERGLLVALMLTSCELPLAFRSTQYEPLFSKSFADDDASWLKTVERIKDLVGKRNEIDVIQRRMMRRRRITRALSWLLVWPLGAIILTLAIGYLLAPFQPVRPDVYRFAAEQWDDGVVFAVGSIALEGDELPTNHAEISCRRDTGECVEVRAELRDGMLAALSDRRQIIRWDEQVIVSSSSSPCGEVVMTIDRALETVNTVRTRTSNDEMCAWMNARNSYRLVDGYARADASERARDPYVIAGFAAVLLLWTTIVLLRIVGALRR